MGVRFLAAHVANHETSRDGRPIKRRSAAQLTPNQTLAQDLRTNMAHRPTGTLILSACTQFTKLWALYRGSIDIRRTDRGREHDGLQIELDELLAKLVLKFLRSLGIALQIALMVVQRPI